MCSSMRGICLWVCFLSGIFLINFRKYAGLRLGIAIIPQLGFGQFRGVGAGLTWVVGWARHSSSGFFLSRQICNKVIQSDEYSVLKHIRMFLSRKWSLPSQLVEASS